MNAGNLWFFLKILPLLVFTAVIFSYFGWWLRRRFHAPVVSSAKPTVVDDLPARERVKKLEHALSKSEAAQKSLKQEMETVQAKSINKAAHEKTARELTEAQHRLDGDQKRIAALETELKRTRDALNAINSKTAETNKGQRERAFALENELSKVRGELAAIQARPDNTLQLQTEVDRLRESLTNSNRVVGELRKQEAAANLALEKAQKKLAAAVATTEAPEPETSPLTAPLGAAFPPAPDRTSEAKADLERIQAQNARKNADSFTAEQARLTVEHAAEKAAAEKAAAEKAAAEKAAAEKAAAEKAAAEKAAAEKAAAEQTAAEQAAAEVVAEDAAVEDLMAEAIAVEPVIEPEATPVVVAAPAASPAPVQADLFAAPPANERPVS